MRLLLVILLFLSLLLIPIGIMYLGYWIPKKYGKRKLGYLISSILLLGMVYSIYDAIYPSDKFYEEEFKDITGIELRNAEVLKSSASYPDFHGDYCSAALIQLEETEYAKLLADIQNDKRFTDSELTGSIELYEVTERKELNFSYKASRTGDPDEYYFIGFLADGKTILIQKCIT
jgi:hypothetical protein